MADENLLEVRNLITRFYDRDGVVRAVDGVDFEVRPGETLGIVGESGSGKSVTALSIMRLVRSPPGRIASGSVRLAGTDLLRLNESQMQKVRGNDISMIFQEPVSSLDPLYPVGAQIVEAVLCHCAVTRREAVKIAASMLGCVGLPHPEHRMKDYTHQFSGGMAQRVMIAMALVCKPRLLIADEPTTALDVTTQAQILQLLGDLKAEFQMSVLLITHDLAVVAEMADRVVVMYAGEVVEYTDIESLFENPRHPYTWGLVGFVPPADHDVERLVAIPGSVPNPKNLPSGCRFHQRCPLADGICVEKHPVIEAVESGHWTRCWHHDQIKRLDHRQLDRMKSFDRPSRVE